MNTTPRTVNRLSYQGGSRGFIKTIRQQKKNAPRDGGGKKRGIRAVFADVKCDIHGRHDIKGVQGKFLYVAPPRTKAERFSGCPLCNPY